MFDMKLCIGIAKGWAEQDVRLKNWVEVLQSQALTERVFEFELPDYKLLNANEVRFCQQLSENIEKSSKELKTTPKIFVLPYQNILMDEAECLDKIAYFIKKVCKEKGRKEPTVLVVGSAFYQYKNVDFVDYAQYLLTEDEENKWKQDKALKEKSVLSVGIPFRLNMEMCQRAAEQPEQAAELAKFQAYPKKVLFVLGGLQDNYQIKFDVADALRLADRALDFAMSGYKVIFMNQPTTPNDVTDFIYDFGRRNDMLFYNRKSLMNGDASLRYDSKFLHEFMAQQQRCGDMYPATGVALRKRLSGLGVNLCTGCRVQSLGQKTVTMLDCEGNTRLAGPFDTVVLALGSRADETLAKELQAAGIPHTSIGDCVRAGKMLQATGDAMRAVWAL